jgi:hypothetical protein
LRFEIRREGGFQLALGGEDELDGLAHRALAASSVGHRVGAFLDDGAGIGRRDGEAALAHGAQVDQVVAHEGQFGPVQAELFEQSGGHRMLVADALVNVGDAEVGRPAGDDAGIAAGDDRHLDADALQQHDAEAVLDVAFGNSGFNPNGVRAGGDSSGKTAFDVIDERRFKDYRTDETLNVRQIKVALKKLRYLKKEGRLEFSIQKTIDKTSENGGELELVHERSRKNDLKLLLLMDVGGSMSPHAARVSKII